MKILSPVSKRSRSKEFRKIENKIRGFFKNIEKNKKLFFDFQKSFFNSFFKDNFGISLWYLRFNEKIRNKFIAMGFLSKLCSNLSFDPPCKILY